MAFNDISDKNSNLNGNSQSLIDVVDGVDDSSGTKNAMTIAELSLNFSSRLFDDMLDDQFYNDDSILIQSDKNKSSRNDSASLFLANIAEIIDLARSKQNNHKKKTKLQLDENKQLVCPFVPYDSSLNCEDGMNEQGAEEVDASSIQAVSGSMDEETSILNNLCLLLARLELDDNVEHIVRNLEEALGSNQSQRLSLVSWTQLKTSEIVLDKLRQHYRYDQNRDDCSMMETTSHVRIPLYVRQGEHVLQQYIIVALKKNVNAHKLPVNICSSELMKFMRDQETVCVTSVLDQLLNLDPNHNLVYFFDTLNYYLFNNLLHGLVVSWHCHTATMSAGQPIMSRFQMKRTSVPCRHRHQADHIHNRTDWSLIFERRGNYDECIRTDEILFNLIVRMLQLFLVLECQLDAAKIADREQRHHFIVQAKQAMLRKFASFITQINCLYQGGFKIQLENQSQDDTLLASLVQSSSVSFSSSLSTYHDLVDSNESIEIIIDDDISNTKTSTTTTTTRTTTMKPTTVSIKLDETTDMSSSCSLPFDCLLTSEQCSSMLTNRPFNCYDIDENNNKYML